MFVVGVAGQHHVTDGVGSFKERVRDLWMGLRWMSGDDG